MKPEYIEPQYKCNDRSGVQARHCGSCNTSSRGTRCCGCNRPSLIDERIKVIDVIAPERILIGKEWQQNILNLPAILKI